MTNCLECGRFTSNPKFCNRSHAAIYNNRKFPKRKRVASRYTCLYCDKKLTGSSKKYCNNNCQSEWKYYNLVVPKIEQGKSVSKRYLVERDGEKCSICGIGPSWNDKFLSLEIDHIDGNRKNNIPKNLRLVCPNCHSQTDTFRGKRTKGQNSHLRVSDDELLKAVRRTTSIRQALIEVGYQPTGTVHYRRIKKLLNK